MGERLERLETEISPMRSCISYLDVAKLLGEQHEMYSRSLREHEIADFLGQSENDQALQNSNAKIYRYWPATPQPNP